MTYKNLIQQCMSYSDNLFQYNYKRIIKINKYEYMESITIATENPDSIHINILRDRVDYEDSQMISLLYVNKSK